MYPMTVNEKLSMIQKMLEATENTLMEPASQENDNTRHTRHLIALMNLQRLGDLVREAERDVAAALINDARVSTIAIRFDAPAKLA